MINAALYMTCLLFSIMDRRKMCYSSVLFSNRTLFLL